MTKNELEEWLSDFNQRIDSAFRFSFPVRDLKLQAEAAQTLELYHSDIDAKRLEFRDANDSDNANMFLGMLCYAQSVTQLLRMWIELRNDEPNKAWDTMVDAQNKARAAMRAHLNCAACMTNYVRLLDTLEHVLFPQQQFVSASFVLQSSDCSLCDGPYHECDHIAGFPYNGEFCVEIYQNFSTMDHVALVQHPEDKHCRTTSFSEDGFDVDSFTLRRTPRDKDKDKEIVKATIMTAR